MIIAKANEFNIFTILRYALGHRKITIIGAEPISRLTARPLSMLVALAKKFPNVSSAEAAYNHALHYGSVPYRPYWRHYLPALEPWFEAELDFVGADGRFGEYGYPYKQVCAKYVAGKFTDLFVMRHLAEQAGEEPVEYLIGDAMLSAMYRRIYDQGHEPGPRLRHRGYRLVNALMGLMVIAWIFIFALRRLRFSPPPPESILLGWDTAGVIDHAVEDLAEDKTSAMVVFRNEDGRKRAGPALDGLRHCMVTDGIFDVSGALSSVGRAIGDIQGFQKEAGDLFPPLFARVAAMAWRRAQFRALFRRFRFVNFMGNDDYNVEHIIRSQELRKLGCRSLGKAHGVPIHGFVQVHWRYIDFDIYYTFGKEPFRTHYYHKWPPGMEVKDVGAWGMPRAKIDRPERGRSNAIVYYSKPTPGEDRSLAEITRLAACLPDHDILLQKKKSRQFPDYDQKLEKLAADFDNIHLADANSYDLMLEHRYAVSDASTVSIEAVQFGMISYVLDVDDRHGQLFFRDVPGFCLRSGEEIAAAIRAVESAAAAYPRDSFADVCDLSGRNVFEVAGKDMLRQPHAS